jgi:hypothetical protein
MMDFPILKSIQCSPTEFVSAWVSCYGSGTYSEADYNKGLNLAGQLSPENIQLLFEWTNTGPLSKKKQATLAKSKIRLFSEYHAFSLLVIIIGLKWIITHINILLNLTVA